MTELLYPGRCPVCEAISDGICPECRRKLPYIREGSCFRCGQPMTDPDAEFCPACDGVRRYFDQGRSLLRYEGNIRESIHRIKYQNRREYLNSYAEEMAAFFHDWLGLVQPEVIIPIPMYPKDERIRGFNQALLLAEQFGNKSGLPVKSDLLRKTVRTGEQKKLDIRERRSNLERAYQGVYGGYDRVLLMDDVFTTGATMDAAAYALKRSGVQRVYFLTVCTGSRDR